MNLGQWLIYQKVKTNWISYDEAESKLKDLMV